ncbi:MAG TPA: nicotinate-nucleotide adenylyltransferase [Gemmatimonadaceae bacterium]|nr:nicotinate-nucleotide adenylyltransferase [Gemmatimonadaceae bacterium]
MRIGLLGGSFDPPHTGHLLAASDAFDTLELDRLVFVPAAIQPLKAHVVVATTSQRLEMVKRLVSGDPRFEVSSIEIDRGGLSYTVDTLAAMSAEWPAAELFWLVGADVPRTFPKWREPERIVQLATVVVLQRTGEAPDLSAMPGAPRLLATRRIDISSTEIRQRVREGKSIRGFVPDSVAEFIAADRLYR